MDAELRESLVSQPGTSRLVTVEWCKDSEDVSLRGSEGGTSRNNLFCVSPSQCAAEEGGREWSWRFGKQRTAQARDECFLFTLELEGKEKERGDACGRMLKVVLRSVALGGQILSLRAGKRREAKFRERASVDDEASHWVVLQADEEGGDEKGEGQMGGSVTRGGIHGRSCCWLLNCSRPEVRIGPLRLRPVSPLSLRSSLPSASGVVSTSGCENEIPDDTRERQSLLLEAKAVVAKLGKMIGQANMESNHQETTTTTIVPPPHSRHNRVQPRRGSKWLATFQNALHTRNKKTSGEKESASRTDTKARPVPSQPTRSPTASYANDMKTIEETTKSLGVVDHNRGRSPILDVTPSVSECEAPAPKMHLPVPLKQNILAQIRLGVKLKTPAKPRRNNKGDIIDYECTSENCDPACTPMNGKQSSSRNNGGLMSELRRNLAGRRKSIGEIHSPNIDSETEESSCNWSPLSVNN